MGFLIDFLVGCFDKMDGGVVMVAGVEVMSMSSSLGVSPSWVCLTAVDLELSLVLGSRYFHFLTSTLCLKM